MEQKYLDLPPHDNHEQIIIIGAGIAGLSLAIQLATQKKPCIILEARSRFSAATSGVRISAAGVRILENMGVTNIGSPTRKLHMYFGSRKIDFIAKNNEVENSAIIVTRLAVFEKLKERIDALGVPVVYDFNLEQVINNQESLIAVSTKGQKISGKYLVGADGVGSRIRRTLNPETDTNKRYAGYLGIGFIYPSEQKVEMSLFNTLEGSIGLASIGKIDQSGDYQNNFLWTHLPMPETEAKSVSVETIYNALHLKAAKLPPVIKRALEECLKNPKTVCYYQSVYNGELPEKWFNDKIFLIGDAAHPYGPGGQGISLALQDAEALAQLLKQDPTNHQKAHFHKTRAAAARAKGETAEKRNRPSNQPHTNYQLWKNYLMMKAYQIISGARIRL